MSGSLLGCCHERRLSWSWPLSSTGVQKYCLKDAKKLLIFVFQSSSGKKDQTYIWIIVWMDVRHITHHSASAANACQQGKEKFSQKHPKVVNSNLLGQNQVFHPEKLWLTLWLIMLWRKPKGILTPAATPHLLVCWRPGRRRQYQCDAMNSHGWKETTCDMLWQQIKLIKLSFDMTGFLGQPVENLHQPKPRINTK